MKKKLLLLLPEVALVLGGCARPAESRKLQVVAAIFPEYDWVRQLTAGDDSLELTLLVDDGLDPHSFQPSVKDMVAVSQCDLLIFGGGESDEWLEELLREPSNPSQQVVELLPLLGETAHQAETVDGMQVREAEDETDEHVWLSLRNAEVCTQAIADQLKKLDPSNKTEYEDNEAAYKEELTGLDKEYQDTVGHAKRKTLLFADRFPFRYLADDYGLKYYAAFKGCSAETEASFKTITFLANKVDEENLPYIMTIEGSDHKIAKSVISNTKKKTQQILTMDSMQSTTAQDVKDGKSYLSVMEENLSVLQKALN